MAAPLHPWYHGMDINDLDNTTPEEVDGYLAWARRNHPSLYVMTANTIWLENRPDFAKLHYGTVLPNFFRQERSGYPVLPEGVMMQSIGQLPLYIALDWQTGIRNEFRVLQGMGVNKAQLMEITMAAQMFAGMKGLESVYQAVAPFIRDFQDRPEPAQFPAGWAPDVEAFTSGLDTSTPELTEADRTALIDWYMNNGGEVPKWVTFLAKHHPDLLKAYRLKWEGAFRTGALPKQCAPFMMIYQNVAFGYRDGLRQAVQLGKAWALTKPWLMLALCGAAYYYTGFEGLDMAEDAVGDIL